MSIIAECFCRKKATFPRGVHPADCKQPSAGAAVEVLPTPAEIRVALLQHLGAACRAVVKPRAEVAAGDVVGESDGFVSAPVHTGLNGTAARQSTVTLPNGRHVGVVPIRVSTDQPLSGRDLWNDIYGGRWPSEGLDRYRPDVIAAAARAAGLVGLGGAAFPTHVKLTRNDEKPIDTLLVNGCECEPYLTADYRLMVEAPDAVVCGALLARRATGASQVIICVEDNKPKAIETLQTTAAGTDVRVKTLQTKYPQGGEKQLVSAMLKRTVPGGGLPLDVGVVVVNVATAASLAGAVVRGRPLTHRIVSVSGAAVREPKNLLVPIGASYRALIDYCGGLAEDAVRIVAGGPMMGFTLGNLDVPVTKGTSGITVLSRAEVFSCEQTACVRCGRCVDVCPMRLVPTRLALAARIWSKGTGNADLARPYHPTACMECGCCAYVCPAGLPLVQLIRLAKVMVQ